MSEVIIRGSCPIVSKSFIKAWIHSTIAVLAFHGHFLQEGIVVRILPPSHKEWLPTPKCPNGVVGWWWPGETPSVAPKREVSRAHGQYHLA